MPTQINTKNRVFFFSLTDGVYGGEKCLLTIVSALSESSSIDPVVVVPAEGRLTDELAMRGISWIGHTNFEPEEIWQIPLLFVKALRWILKMQPRLLYFNANNYWRPFEIPAARVLGIPVVTHHHTVPDTISPFHRFSNLVIANSHYVASKLQIKGVQVVDNPLEIEAFDHSIPDRSAYNLQPQEIGVFFIGQIKPQKGVDFFLDAAEIVSRLIPEVRFILIGDTKDQDYSQHVRSRITYMSKVDWIGFNSKIEKAYKTADIVVMPSSWDEPFGRIAIEAGAASKPILCTNVGGVREIVRDGETGLLVTRDNVAELVEGLIRLIRSPELRRRLGLAGRRQAELRFAAPIVAKRLEKLINRIICASSHRYVD